MAILPNDSPLKGASGKLGGELVLKHYKETGKTVVSKMPDMSRVKPSLLLLSKHSERYRLKRKALL